MNGAILSIEKSNFNKPFYKHYLIKKQTNTMKKIFLFAALTAAVMSSCSNDDDVIQSSNSNAGLDAQKIAFVTDNAAVTRAGDVTSLTNFKVTGVTSTGTTYFANETFNFANSMFSSSTPYYWPTSGTMDFYAANAGTINYASGSASMTFTANNGTTDYVTAVSKAASKAVTVPLSFKHIMSRLSIKVKPYDVTDGYDYKISKINVCAMGSGKYTFGTSTGSVGTWSDVKSYVDYVYTGGLPATTGKSNSGKVISLSEAYYLIPPTAAQSDMITVDFYFEVYKNGVLVGNFTGSSSVSTDITNIGLAPGKSVCLVLMPSFDTVGEKPIAFTATVTPWGSTTDVEAEI